MTEPTIIREAAVRDGGTTPVADAPWLALSRDPCDPSIAVVKRHDRSRPVIGQFYYKAGAVRQLVSGAFGPWWNVTVSTDQIASVRILKVEEVLQ